MAQALEDMRELAASDNVDTFVISYNSLLQVRAISYDIIVLARQRLPKYVNIYS